jgi:putative membrane protein
MRAWLLTFHLIGIIMWMGGFMVFARLLAYHAVEPPSARPTLSKIEARLNYVVALPGAALAIACGVLLVRQHGLSWLRVALWLHVKLVLVVALLLAHLGATRAQRRIARLDPNAPIPRRGWRVLHFLLGLALIAIIALAVQQPMVAGAGN